MKRDFDDEIAWRVFHINHHWRVFQNRRFEESGLRGPFLIIISGIAKNPGASQDTISENMAMDKTTVARCCKRLEDGGYIRREINSENRRQYRLFLTPAGEAMNREFDAAMAEWGEQLSSGLSDEERAAATRLLERMVKNTEQVTSDY